jgi:hypothetical protein
MLDILDAKQGIYGHRYNLKDGGLLVNLVNGSVLPAKILTISAEIKAGKVKNFKP